MVVLEGIREFAAVVDAGSFTAGAEYLELSKSVVSNRISALEKRLGVQLLRRTTRSINLTEAGAAYFEHCRQLLADAQQAEELLQRLGGEPRGRLRVTCTDDFATDHISPALPDFCARYPQIIPEIVTRDDFVDLVAENFDVGIRFGPLDNPAMVVRRLGKLRGYPVASPDYLERRGKPTAPADLGGHDCLIFTPYPWGREWRFVNARGERARAVVGERAAFNTGIALRAAALNGLGIALLATVLSGRHVRQGDLVRVLDDWEPDTDEAAERVICAVYPDNRRIPPKVRVFVDFLSERIGDTPYWDAGV